MRVLTPAKIRALQRNDKCVQCGCIKRELSIGQLVCLSGSSAERPSQVTESEYTILVASKTVGLNEMRG